MPSKKPVRSAVKSDAMLFFGIAYDKDEVKSPEDYDNNWEDYYAAKKGVGRPKTDYMKDKAAHHLVWERIIELNTACPIAVEPYGSETDKRFFVAMKKSMKISIIGEAFEVENLDFDPDWKREIREFCKLMGLPFREPKWWLVSYAA